MKLKLFLIGLALAIVVLALGGWTVKGIRWMLRVPASLLRRAIERRGCPPRGRRRIRKVERPCPRPQPVASSIAPSQTGPAFWGPGDLYTFLVTGEESGGAYFAMEAFVPPGGGPPPHIHSREDETFYLLEGEIEFLLGDETILAGPGDFVTSPAAPSTASRTSATRPAKLVCSRRRHRGFFAETLDRAPNAAARGLAGQRRGSRCALRRHRLELRHRVP